MVMGSGAPLRWGKKTGGPMANKVVERIQARYEVQEVAFGTVYSWSPQSVLVECGCGETVALTASKTSCDECGAEHAGVIGAWLGPVAERIDDEALHPWRYWHPSQENGIPF